VDDFDYGLQTGQMPACVGIGMQRRSATDAGTPEDRPSSSITVEDVKQ
jgi:hypothetical protein